MRIKSHNELWQGLDGLAKNMLEHGRESTTTAYNCSLYLSARGIEVTKLIVSLLFGQIDIQDD
jgi:hypothetical protein